MLTVGKTYVGFGGLVVDCWATTAAISRIRISEYLKDEIPQESLRADLRLEVYFSTYLMRLNHAEYLRNGVLVPFLSLGQPDGVRPQNI